MSYPIGPEELLNSFNHVCSDILDTVKHFKMRCHKVKNQPLLNYVTQNMRRVCRQVSVSGLQINCRYLIIFLSNYQNAVKAARSSYFSRIILHDSNYLKILFSIIDKVLSPSIHFSLLHLRVCVRVLLIRSIVFGQILCL